MYRLQIGLKVNYSYRSAWIGSWSAALRAGYTPKNTPTAAENVNAMMMDQAAPSSSKCVIYLSSIILQSGTWEIMQDGEKNPLGEYGVRVWIRQRPDIDFPAHRRMRRS